MIDKGKIIKKYLSMLGKDVSIVKNDGSTVKFRAVIEQTWRRNKSRFEDVSSKIGQYYNDYYFYYGPYDIDISETGTDEYLLSDGIKYELIRYERVIIDTEIQFYTAVLKKILEAEDVFE